MKPIGIALQMLNLKANLFFPYSSRWTPSLTLAVTLRVFRSTWWWRLAWTWRTAKAQEIYKLARSFNGPEAHTWSTRSFQTSEIIVCATIGKVMMVVLLHVHRVLPFDAHHSHSNSKYLTIKRKNVSNISEIKIQKKLTKYFTRKTNIADQWPIQIGRLRQLPPQTSVALLCHKCASFDARGL